MVAMSVNQIRNFEDLLDGNKIFQFSSVSSVINIQSDLK